MDDTFDAEVFAKMYKITAVQIMDGATGLLGGMAGNADQFKSLMSGFLAGFGAYLSNLTDAQMAELYSLLVKQQSEE